MRGRENYKITITKVRKIQLLEYHIQ